MAILFFTVFTLIITATPVANASSELPVDVRADILLQEIIRAAKSGQSTVALKKIDDYRQLEEEGHKTPPAVLFFEAKQASKVGQHDRAFVALEAYLAVANHSESTYNEAVKLYSGMKDKADPVMVSRLRPALPSMKRIPGKNYEMGKYEVTQGEWRAVMGNNPSFITSCGDTCPVENVSWDDIKEFIRKLNAKTGKQYRLPSEAEWEYACRAGAHQEYCGSDNLDFVAWHVGNSGSKTHPVGQKQANGYGLYDMSGNLWEWVEDCYDGDCAKRVLRGGSWDDGPQFVRAADRSRDVTAYRYFNLGFRLARMLP